MNDSAELLFMSTRAGAPNVGLREAVLTGLAPDGGLYLHAQLPVLRPEWLADLRRHDWRSICREVARVLVGRSVARADLERIVDAAITFPAPLVRLDERLAVLELFHGPTLAFKDFGARFMAQLVSHFVQGRNRQLTILVATSGDTGSAVAHGFHNLPGIDVVVLYPRGKVSAIQEQQLTTVGGNVTALEIDGTFDDCQRLVKRAFADPVVRERRDLSSANSINIARLIPQSFYYFGAAAQLDNDDRPTFAVPSGNFGNLTGGILAARLGLRVETFVAATNANSAVPEYLATGVFNPRPSVVTLSNSMDVGDPSNFDRLRVLFGDSAEAMRRPIVGYSFDDTATLEAIRAVHERHGYVIDPHGAVAYLGARRWLESPVGAASRGTAIVLATAHPAKFGNVIERALGAQPPLPEALARCARLERRSIALAADYSGFKEYLLATATS